MKKIYILLTIVLSLFVNIISGKAIEGQSKNLDNVIFDTTYQGVLNNYNDENKYNIVMNNSGTLYFNFLTKINDFNYFIYDNKGNLLWDFKTTYQLQEDKNNRNGNVSLKNGEYVLIIKKLEDTSVKEYNLTINFQDSQESFRETNENDEMSRANKIDFGIKYKGQLAVNDRLDYYKFNIDKPVNIVIDIFSKQRRECYVAVINAKSLEYMCYESFSIDSNNGSTFKLEFFAEEAGEYYILFEADEIYHDHAQTGDYSFKLSETSRFSDVSTNTWYYQVVNNCYELGLMTGVDDTHFSPDTYMSRGMVATVLYRMSGAPNVVTQSKFSDVKEGLWYTSAIKWATEKGIVSGYQNGKFGPDDGVTREQLAVMLRNYAKMKGLNTTSTNNLQKFKDYKNVTSYAKSALGWAVDKGIMSGTSTGNLAPTSKATRAECAKMLLQTSLLK